MERCRVRVFRCVHRVRRFETINRNSVLSVSIEFNNEMSFLTINDFEWAIIGWLEGWFGGIVSDKHMSTLVQVFVNEGGCLGGSS